MTAAYILENKISSIQKYLTRLQDFKKKKKADFKKDDILQSALERNLYLACQSTIELAEASVKHLGLRKPRSYKESFEILAENKVIDQKLLEKMQKLAGFRNILTHAYEKLELESLLEILNEGLKDIETFIKKIKKKLRI